MTLTVLCPGMTDTAFQKATGNKRPGIRWNISTPQKVADYGYKSLMKGKTLAIPGFANKVMSVLHRIFPRITAASIIRKIHEANRND